MNAVNMFFFMVLYKDWNKNSLLFQDTQNKKQVFHDDGPCFYLFGL